MWNIREQSGYYVYYYNINSILGCRGSSRRLSDRIYKRVYKHNIILIPKTIVYYFKHILLNACKQLRYYVPVKDTQKTLHVFNAMNYLPFDLWNRITLDVTCNCMIILLINYTLAYSAIIIITMRKIFEADLL